MSSIVTKAINNVDCHALKLYRNVASLFDVRNISNKYSDIQIIVQHKTFYCHKLILQLNGYDLDMQLDPKDTILLQNINPDQFFEVLQFMYTGEVLVSTNNIESLLSAACTLGMDDLIKICFRFLEDIINQKKAKMISDDTRLKLTSLHKTLAIKCFNNVKQSDRFISKSSETLLKVILSAHDLEVESEEEVCDLLLNWLQLHTDDVNQIHLDQLLSLIRWSGISLDYITSKLFTNKILMSDTACVTFLSKVTTYLMTGVQFDGLKTFHRRSTGVDNSLLIIGLHNETSMSSKMYSIDLKYIDTVTKLKKIPTTINIGSVACINDNNVYVTGAGDDTFNETWNWKIKFGWNKRRNMLTSRRSHCAAIINSKMYVLGGTGNMDILEDDDDTTLSSVEIYNLDTNRWFSAGDLIHPVWGAVCATYKSSIYVFGGVGKDNEPVDYVQVYDTEKKRSRVLLKPMPHAHIHMRAVLWEVSAILLGPKTCYIYNFETDTWQERKQFKTDLIYFGIALDNTLLYLVGGGMVLNTNRNNVPIVRCTDKIRRLSISNILKNEPAVWQHHAELPEPSLINAHGHISLSS